MHTWSIMAGIAGAVMAFAAPAAAASKLTTLASLTGTGDGAGPMTAMISVGGVFYGLTADGGASGNGMLFKLDPATGKESVLSSFAGTDGSIPIGGLLDVSGVLYGTTDYGGPSGYGTVFKYDPVSSTRTVLASFGGGDGANPAGALIEVGGTLYGTTQYGGASGNGTVFALDPASGTKSVIYSFAGGKDGSQPYAALLDIHGTLYGTTVYGGSGGLGTLFRLDPVHGTEKVLHDFAGSDGSEPASGLIAIGTTLYGTTALGGASGDGTVFTYNTKTGKQAVLHGFAGPDGLYPYAALIEVSGTLYGTAPYGGTGASGTVFSIDPPSGTFTVLHDFAGDIDGIAPYGGLIASGSTLYGTASYGGVNGQGAAFAVTIPSGQESITYSFTGSTPIEGAAVAAVNGALITTSSNTGAVGFGSTVSIDPATGHATPLYTFDSLATGTIPAGAAIPSGNFLYGVTLEGGAGCSSCGTIYKIALSDGAETVVHSFGAGQTNDGTLPETAPILVAGTLYGTTVTGGDPTCQCGVVYKFVIKTGKETVLYRFTGGNDGAEPFGGLIYQSGTLYGTTADGGSGGAGTLFSVDAKTGAEAVLYAFSGGADGGYPYAAVSEAGGLLYGTTYGGGASGNGTVFKFDPAAKAETVLHSFAGGSDGADPGTALLNVKGKLYGATAYGGVGGYGCEYVCGTIFVLDTVSGAESLVHTFLGSGDGGNMFGGAMIVSGGVIYGATGSGGAAGLGTVFSLTP